MIFPCSLIGHKYIPLNQEGSNRLVYCPRCGKAVCYQSVMGGPVSWYKEQIEPSTDNRIKDPAMDPTYARRMLGIYP